MVVPAVDVCRPRGGRGRLRRRLVVLRREERGGALVARLVDARSAQRDGRIVRPRVGRLRAGGDAGGSVGALEGDGDRVVVPAVRVRRASRRARLRRRLVVLERQHRRCRVPGDVAARPSDRRSARVRPAVGRVRGARLEPGGRVAPVEVDGEAVVVPTVRIGGARRCGGRRRRGLVDLEGLPDGCRAAVALGGARERRARRVARERDCVAAGRREDDRLWVRHRPVDRDVGRVPAVEPQRSGDDRRDYRRSRVAWDVREARRRPA